MCGAAKYISCRRRGLGGIGCCWPSIFFEDWARRIRPHRSRKALFADVRLPNDASETESEEYRSNGDANRDAKDAREERLHGP